MTHDDETVEREKAKAVGHLLDMWEQYPNDERNFLMDPLRDALNSLMRAYEGSAALSALPRADDGWRTIESADRSGDWVSLWAPGIKPQPFYWSKRLSMWVQSDDDNPVHWSGGPDDFGPTHWKPLPAPPAQAGER